MDFIFGYMLGALGIWQIVIALGIMSSFWVMVVIGNIIEFSYKTITRKEKQTRETFSFPSNFDRCLNDDFYFIQEVHAYIRGSRGATTIASAVIFAIIGLTIWHSGGIETVAIVSDWWKIVIGFVGFGVAWAIFKVSSNLGGLHEIIKEQIEKILMSNCLQMFGLMKLVRLLPRSCLPSKLLSSLLVECQM